MVSLRDDRIERSAVCHPEQSEGSFVNTVYGERSFADAQDDKKRLRGEYRARAAQLPEDYRREADRAIREALLGSALWRNAESVFLYVSVRSEPDTRALIIAALEEGKRVYVPRCCPERVMEAVRIRSLAELHPGVLGIPEPAGGDRAAPGELALAVVPCVTATEDGARLGHGAGYYDRFLRLHACPTVCLCYGRILADRLPMDKYDIWMGHILSENGLSKTEYG